VLGCAGFGYAIRSRRMSCAMIEANRGLMLLFSLAAIGFHMLFAGILTLRFGGAAATSGGGLIWFPGDLALLILLGGGVLAALPDRAWLIAGAALYAVSLASFALVGFDGWTGLAAYGAGELPELIWLVPVITAGLLLCPYLDLTFHRARQEAPSKHAFAVFGATFTIMLLLSAAVWFDTGPGLPTLLLGHFVGQAIFTTGAHLRELREVGRRHSPGVCALAAAALAFLAVVVPAAAMISDGDDVRIAEGLYLRYLALYGLVFPAAVLIFIGPWPVIRGRKRATAALLATCIVLAPSFEAAFVHRITWTMIAPTLALVAWALARGKAARPSERAASRMS
jgi:hypothetical protein